MRCAGQVQYVNKGTLFNLQNAPQVSIESMLETNFSSRSMSNGYNLETREDSGRKRRHQVISRPVTAFVASISILRQYSSI